MTDVFAERVIGDFVAEHEQGRTPNPCARCNGEIKFGAFLRRADELGIDMVATGHYVRNERDDAGVAPAPGRRPAARTRPTCCTCSGQRQLSRSLFPVGALSKAETQGARRAVRPAGRVEARLSGAVLRAERRRRRVRAIAGALRSCTRGARWSTPTGTCSASTTARSRSRSASAAASGSRSASPPTCSRSTPPRTGWWSGPRELLAAAGCVADRVVVGGRRAPVRRAVRGRGPRPLSRRRRCRPWSSRSTATGSRVTFRSPQRAIAPGQSAVVYRGDEVLGGGRIVATFR